MLILASTSPRRREMLALLGLQFQIESVDVDESRHAGESPHDMSVRLALFKAQTVFDYISARGAGNPVLAGDTVVAIGSEVFGKPRDREHAITILRRLSGDTHTVFSAVALVAGGHRTSCISTTKVTFDRIDQQQIERYCNTAEPFDKAGAYGIQGVAGAFVKHISGSYSGVVGLPLWETRQLLREFEP